MRGDEFNRISLSFLSSLYNSAWRLTGNDADAEDLVQQTYETAFRHARELRSLEKCKAWLFRIMRNHFLAAERRRRPRPWLAVVSDDSARSSQSDRIPSAGIPVEEEVIARMAGPAISRALAGLPEMMRTAVLLCDLDGFTYEEIAEIMDCPVGTVRSRIARARGQLMDQLAREAQALGIERGKSK